MKIEISLSEYSGRWSANASLKYEYSYGNPDTICVTGSGRNRSTAVRRVMEQICEELAEIDYNEGQ